MGLEGDLVHRELSFGIGANPDIDLLKIQARGGYSLFKGADLFLTLGIVDDDIRILNYAGSQVTFLSGPSLVYGAGFRLTVLQRDSFDLGGGGDYERFTLQAGAVTSSPPSDAEVVWQEFRFFGGFRLKDVPYFVPYGGFFLSAVRGDMTFSNPALPGSDIEESESLGIFFGGDFRVWRDLLIGIELRLLAETSGAFSARYPF